MTVKKPRESAPPVNFRVELPAERASVPKVRHGVTELARAVGMTGERLNGVRLAVTEAAANVVLHAYPDGEGLIHVDAGRAGDELWVFIADDGRGLRSDAESSGLGQGLRLIARCAGSFTVVERSGGGTEVRMRFGLRQPRGSVASATSAAWSRFSTTT